MLVNRQCIEALVAIKWQIVEKGSRSAYLRCFGEHFGVPPRWWHACLIAYPLSMQLVKSILTIFSGLYMFWKRIPQNMLEPISVVVLQLPIANAFGKHLEKSVVFMWYVQANNMTSIFALSNHFSRLIGKIVSIIITETVPRLLLMVPILEHASRPHSVLDGGPSSSIAPQSDTRLPYPSQLDGLYGSMAHTQQGFTLTHT